MNVTFDNSQGYGKLVIGDADGSVDKFSGQIFGFSGTPGRLHIRTSSRTTTLRQRAIRCNLKMAMRF